MKATSAASRGSGGSGAKQLRRIQRCSGSVASVRNVLFAGALLLAAVNVFRLGSNGAARREMRLQRQRQRQRQGGDLSSQQSASSTSETGPQGNSSLKKLVIGIPTVPRQGDYLTGTIESLLDWLPPDDGNEGFLQCEVRVVVMNMGGDKHSVFHGLVRRFSSHPNDSLTEPDKYAPKANELLRLVDSPETCTDPTPDAPEPNHTHNPEDIPGRMGRKQNCDMLNLLSYVQGMGAAQMDYLLLMEDDFATCPHAIQKTVAAINKLNAMTVYKGWLALRVSYGMNGVVLSRSNAATFASYVLEHRTRRPVDLLFTEFVLPSAKRPLNSTKGKEIFVYRWNLFAHRGKVSSFPGRPDRKPWPGCSVEMDKVWSLQSHEKFYHRCAATWEFAPCGSSSRAEKVPARVWSARTATRRMNRTALPEALATDDSAARNSSSDEGLSRGAGDVGTREMRERLFGAAAKEVEGVLVDDIEQRRGDFKKRLEETMSEAMKQRGRRKSGTPGSGVAEARDGDVNGHNSGWEVEAVL